MDDKGYRPNVGIVLLNADNQVLLARRLGTDNWQLPQGGIRAGEAPEQAVYRELREEVGLEEGTVGCIGRTREWLYYDIPEHYPRRQGRNFKGQRQIWFLLRMLEEESTIDLQTSKTPEFDAWRWTDYWAPIDYVVDFKKEIYKKALTELAHYIDIS